MSGELTDLMQPGRAEDFLQLAAMPPFEAGMGRFSPEVAVWLAEFSRLIYRQEGDELPANKPLRRRSAFLEASEWKEVRFFNGLQRREEGDRKLWPPIIPAEDTQAALLRNEQLDCNVLVFRGTLGTLNLLTDLTILAWPLRLKTKASAHHGFIAALDFIWEDILAELLKTTGRIFVTGHSLGGALATLAVCRLVNDEANRFIDRMGALYTFGSPRVGTAGLEENFGGIYHARIVHDADLVAKVPPAFALPFFPPYHHVGSLHELFDDGRMVASSTPNLDVGSQQEGIFELLRLLRGILADLKLGKTIPLPKALKDHTPLLYSKALHRALGG